VLRATPLGSLYDDPIVEPIAKLEGQAQHPLRNQSAREHMVDEMCCTLRHPTATAAQAEAPTFAGEPDQAIGATTRPAKPDKAMREHAAANEALKLALHEQGGANFATCFADVGRGPRSA